MPAADRQPDSLAEHNRLAVRHRLEHILAADKPAARTLAADHMVVHIVVDSQLDKALDIRLADKRADNRLVGAGNKQADTDIPPGDMDKDSQAAPHMVPAEAWVAAYFLTQEHHLLAQADSDLVAARASLVAIYPFSLATDQLLAARRIRLLPQQSATKRKMTNLEPASATKHAMKNLMPPSATKRAMTNTMPPFAVSSDFFAC